MRIFSQRSVLRKGFLAIALFFVVVGGVMGVGVMRGLAVENPIPGLLDNLNRNTQNLQNRAGEVIQDVQEKGIAALGGSHCDQYNGKTKAGGIIPDCDLEHCNYTLDAFLLLAINIIKWILGITGSLALAMFVLGGVQWLLSRGASDEVKKGLNTMINAVIGLAIIFGSWMAVNFIMSTVATAGKGATDEAGKAGNNLMVRLTQGTQKWSDISAVTCIPFTQVDLSKEDYKFEPGVEQNVIPGASSSAAAFVPGGPQQSKQFSTQLECDQYCQVKDDVGVRVGHADSYKEGGVTPAACKCIDYTRIGDTTLLPSNNSCGVKLSMGSQVFYGVDCGADRQGRTRKWAYSVTEPIRASYEQSMIKCIRLKENNSDYEEDNINDATKKWGAANPSCDLVGFCYRIVQTGSTAANAVTTKEAVYPTKTLYSRCAKARQGDSRTNATYSFCSESADSQGGKCIGVQVQ